MINNIDDSGAEWQEFELDRGPSADWEKCGVRREQQGEQCEEKFRQRERGISKKRADPVEDRVFVNRCQNAERNSDRPGKEERCQREKDRCRNPLHQEIDNRDFIRPGMTEVSLKGVF